MGHPCRRPPVQGHAELAVGGAGEWKGQVSRNKGVYYWVVVNTFFLE